MYRVRYERGLTWLLFGVLTLAPGLAAAQEDPATPVRWQRRGDAVQIPVTVFHSPLAANLPTAETLRQGEFQFEISHRFSPPVSTGINALWGLDGPVVNRLGLAYAFTDRIFTTFQRSNLEDNWDLNTKVRLAEGGRDGIPWMVAFAGGGAWNTEVSGRSAGDSRNFQFYAQGVVNVLLGGKWGVGVVPSYLYNSQIRSDAVQQELTLGINGQVYLGRWSILAEWNISDSKTDLEYDSGTFGIELETGGHFFKLVLSNTDRMNPAQFLAGAARPFEADEWRLGFNITRLLRFWGE